MAEWIVETSDLAPRVGELADVSIACGTRITGPGCSRAGQSDRVIGNDAGLFGPPAHIQIFLEGDDQCMLADVWKCKLTENSFRDVVSFVVMIWRDQGLTSGNCSLAIRHPR